MTSQNFVLELCQEKFDLSFFEAFLKPRNLPVNVQFRLNFSCASFNVLSKLVSYQAFCLRLALNDRLMLAAKSNHADGNLRFTSKANQANVNR